MFFGFKEWTNDEILDILKHATHERLFVIYQALRNGMAPGEISRLTDIDPFFIRRSGISLIWRIP